MPEEQKPPAAAPVPPATPPKPVAAAPAVTPPTPPPVPPVPPDPDAPELKKRRQERIKTRDDSLKAAALILKEYKGNVSNIPIGSAYWGLIQAHQTAVAELRDTIELK